MTVDDASPRAAVTPLGAVGTVAGTTAFDTDEAGELPAAERAMTVTVYEVPLVSPEMEHVTAVVVVHVAPPGEAVTVYPVIAEPLATDAVHDAVTLALPRVRLTFVGALGTALIVIDGDAVEAAEVPAAFVARTVNV